MSQPNVRSSRIRFYFCPFHYDSFLFYSFPSFEHFVSELLELPLFSTKSTGFNTKKAMSLCVSICVWTVECDLILAFLLFFLSFFLTDSKNVPRICNHTHTESIRKMSRIIQFCGTTIKFQRFFISVCRFRPDHRTIHPAPYSSVTRRNHLHGIIC